MEFELRRLVLDNEEGIPINRQRFAAIERAVAGSRLAVDIEENYSGLVDQYIEFNEKLVRVVVSMAIRYGITWSDFAAHIQGLNRALIDLLNSAKLYVDHSEVHIAAIKKKAEAPGVDVKGWKEAQRSRSFEFSAIEFLRNHAQHSGLPMQAFSVGGRWVEEGLVRTRKHGCNLFIVPEALSASRGPALEILKKLRAMGGQVDLSKMLRSYLSGVAELHQQVRNSLSTSCATWELIIQSAVDDYHAKHGETSGLHAVEIDGSSVLKEISVFSDVMHRYKMLRDMNSAGMGTFDFEVVHGT